jgi:hypothetical protein
LLRSALQQITRSDADLTAFARTRDALTSTDATAARA